MENNRVRKLWGQEFNIVENGLDEAQVVAFIDDLLSYQKVALEPQKNSVPLRMLADTTIVEANKLAANIIAQAKKEAEAEAARIIARVQPRDQEIVPEAEKEAKVAAKEQIEVTLQAAKENAASKQEQIIALETRTDLDRTRDEIVKALVLGQSQEVVTASPYKQVELIDESLTQNTPVKEMPDKVESESAQEEAENTTLYKGRVELEITSLADFAQMREFERHLRQLPQVKALLIGGSWANGNTVDLFLNEPVPLVDVLRNMPGVAEIKVLQQQSKHPQGKRILIIPKNGHTQPEIEEITATQPIIAQDVGEKLARGPLPRPPHGEQPSLHSEEIELTATSLNSPESLLKLWTLIASLPEVKILSMRKDSSGGIFRLDMPAGFPLDEHLKTGIPGILLVKESNRIQAQLPAKD